MEQELSADLLSEGKTKSIVFDAIALIIIVQLQRFR